MRLQDFIIGLMAFILFMIVIFGFTLDLYSEDNLDINFEDDNTTAALVDIQNQVEEAKDEIQQSNRYIEDRVPGGNETTLGSDVSEDNLISSSLTALTSIPSYISTFVGLSTTTTNAVGGNTANLFLWFIIGSIIVIISFILLSSVLRNRV
jgi:hypothetical protein